MTDPFNHALERAIAAEECIRRLMIIVSVHLPSTHREISELFNEYCRVLGEIEKDAIKESEAK